jgi:hypothetical protein
LTFSDSFMRELTPNIATCRAKRAKFDWGAFLFQRRQWRLCRGELSSLVRVDGTELLRAIVGELAVSLAGRGWSNIVRLQAPLDWLNF